MEKAANAFVNAIDETLLFDKKIAVVCGSGNNGGDGFAVSRLLKNKQHAVDTYLVKFGETLSPDCESNFKKIDKVNSIEPGAIVDFDDYDVIIDSIFGV